MKKQYRIGVLLVALLFVISGCSNQVDEQSKPMMEEATGNNPAPAFTFTDFNGKNVSLSDFKGKKLYIKFWASWCPICLRTLADTEELVTMNRNFEVITVVAPGVNNEKNKRDFKKWFQELDYPNMKVLFDEDGTYMRQFGIRAFPSSAYIDEKGGLMKIQIGYDSNQSIIQTFQ